MQMHHPPNECIYVSVTYTMCLCDQLKCLSPTGGQMGHTEDEYDVVLGKAGVTERIKHRVHCQNML